MNKIICVLLTICSTLGFTASSYSANVDELMNPQYENKITLANMGQVQGIVFRGGQKDAGVTFTLPIDQFVTQAQLTLDITASDAIKDSEASLQVRVNGEIIGSIPLSLAQELKTSYTLDVPSVLIGSNNILSFGLRTEQDNLCLLDGNQAVQQVKILASSSLEMTAQQLDIAADLSFFPSPFWDVQNMLDNPIQLVFPKHVTQSQISAAGSLASWFGVQATYRGVSFVVSKDELPLNNAIVFGAPGDKVGELVLPKTDVPLLKVVVNPRNPLYKLLLIVAEDGAGMRSAVHRLSQLDFKKQQDSISVLKEAAITASEPYDAPRWISTRNPILLSQLVTNEQNMTSKGIWHNSIDFSFRAAPDLFLWDGETIPLNIDYSFPPDAWIDAESSFLNVVFNGQFLQDLPVNKRGALEQLWNRLGGDTRQEKASLPIEPYMIYGDNQLSLYFNVKPRKDLPCGTALDSNIQSRIQNTSTIDLSHTQHFSLLPNLSFFVGASFPFSRLADYSQTVFWLPAEPSTVQLQTLFNLNARSGSATGAVIYQNQVILGTPKSLDAFNGKDILAITSMVSTKFNRLLLASSPFIEQDNTLHIKEKGMSERLLNWFQGNWSLSGREADRYFSSNESWRGFISFESPWSAKRTVVVALASTDQQLAKLDSDLKNQLINAGIRGDAAVITDDNGVTSFNVSPQFPSGQLAWYKMAIWYANQHSALFALLTLFIATILGVAFYRRLEQKARQRLNKE